MHARALIGLAQAHLALGDIADAAAAADEALEMAESFVEAGTPSYLIGLSLVARGEVLLARRAPDEARAVFREALQHLERTLGAEHPATRRVAGRVAS